MSRYIVSRTSLWDDSMPPCKEARLEDLTYQDFRTVNTLAKAKAAHWGTDWFKSGSNHRKQGAMVVRDMPRKDWVVDVPDLVKFYDKYGKLILKASNYKEYPMCLEIYDDYRE